MHRTELTESTELTPSFQRTGMFGMSRGDRLSNERQLTRQCKPSVDRLGEAATCPVCANGGDSGRTKNDGAKDRTLQRVFGRGGRLLHCVRFGNSIYKSAYPVVLSAQETLRHHNESLAETRLCGHHNTRLRDGLYLSIMAFLKSSLWISRPWNRHMPRDPFGLARVTRRGQQSVFLLCRLHARRLRASASLDSPSDAAEVLSKPYSTRRRW